MRGTEAEGRPPSPEVGLRPGVTIVIAVERASEHTRRTVESVLAHGGLGRNVLVVVDAGDGVDEELRADIEAHSAARHLRSPEPSGFLRAIDRAATGIEGGGRDVLLLQDGAELSPDTLETMRAVLGAGERHGIVVPRSNRGSVARIPSATRLGQTMPTPEHSREVFDEVHVLMPRWTVSPTADDVCVLVRHDLVRNHGLLDAAFGSVQAAVVDLSVRMAQLGHSTLIANHAFVAWHALDTPGAAAGSVPEAAAAAGADELLTARYPFLPSVVADFLAFETDALDRFAELLVDSGARPSVLIDLHELTLHYDGTARNAISFLTVLRDRAPGIDADFAVQAPVDVAAFFGIARFGFPVVSADELHVYDVALSLSPLTQTAAILALNRAAARWVVLHLDIIALRSLELRSASWARKRVVKDSLRHADRIVSISAASVDDILDFYPELPADGRLSVLPQGATTARFAARPGDVDFHDLPAATRRVIDEKSFVLVMGNGYPHKQVATTLATLEQSEHTVVSIGGHVEHVEIANRVHSLPPGRLSDAVMQRLMSSARILVYPSGYEGFGLPIVEAVAAGKRVVAFRSAAVEETVRTTGIDEQVDFFDDFAELPAVLDAALDRPAPPAALSAGLRTAAEFDDALIDIVLETMSTPIDPETVRRRWEHFVTLTEYRRDIAVAYEQLDRSHRDSRSYIELMRARRSYRVTERVLGALNPVRRLLARIRSARKRS